MLIHRSALEQMIKEFRECKSSLEKDPFGEYTGRILLSLHVNMDTYLSWAADSAKHAQDENTIFSNIIAVLRQEISKSCLQKEVDALVDINRLCASFSELSEQLEALEPALARFVDAENWQKLTETHIQNVKKNIDSTYDVLVEIKNLSFKTATHFAYNDREIGNVLISIA